MDNITFLFLLLGFCSVSFAADKSTYIVHMSSHHIPASFGDDHVDWFQSSLKTVSDTAETIYTYQHVIHGFSTRLTVEEAEALENLPGILSVLPELKYELHTTRTPEFLGLGHDDNLFSQANVEGDVIIGILDTGVRLESKSFDDTGMGPIPSAWNGACETGTNFTASSCNRKLIGARFFANGYEATLGPIDQKKETTTAMGPHFHHHWRVSCRRSKLVRWRSFV